MLKSDKNKDINDEFSQFNEKNIDSLFKIIDQINTKRSLIVIEETIMKIIEFLNIQDEIQNRLNARKVLTLSLFNKKNSLNDNYDGIVMIFGDCEDQINLFKVFYEKIINQRIKENIFVIVQNLNHSFVYNVKKLIMKKDLEIDEAKKIIETIEGDEINSKIHINTTFTLQKWDTNPFFVEDIFITEINDKYIMKNYFDDPFKTIENLLDSFIKLICNFQKNKIPFFKIGNIYGKGYKSEFLINLIKGSKLSNSLRNTLDSDQYEFYTRKVNCNTDLIVLERNLDFISVLFNQSNYHGLIDDVFGISFSQSDNLNIPFVFDDFYKIIKDFNFSDIGELLKTSALKIQSDYKHKSDMNNPDISLDQVKLIVSEVEVLKAKQDLVDKHTLISELILEKINSLSYKTFFELQNCIFDLNYKNQLNFLKDFFLRDFEQKIVFTLVILISLINNGIKEKDLEWITKEIFVNYGIDSINTFYKLIELELIQVQNSNNSIFSLLSTNLKITNDNNFNTNEMNFKDIMNRQSVYKTSYSAINKIWDLHPSTAPKKINETPIDAIHCLSQNLLFNTYKNMGFTLPSNKISLIAKLTEEISFSNFNTESDPLDKSSLNFISSKIDLNIHGGSTYLNLNKSKEDVETYYTIPETEFVFLFLIGGITRGELTCLKYIQQKHFFSGKKKKFIVLTNGFVNRKKLLNALKI